MMRRLNAAGIYSIAVVVVVVVLTCFVAIVTVPQERGGVIQQEWLSSTFSFLTKQRKLSEPSSKLPKTSDFTDYIEGHDYDGATIDENEDALEGFFPRHLLGKAKRECQSDDDCKAQEGNRCLKAGICRRFEKRCYYEPLTCDAGDACAIDYCDPIVGCSTIPKCDDNDPCTNDTCEASSGQCMHTMNKECPLSSTVTTPPYTLQAGSEQLFLLEVPRYAFVFCEAIADNGDIDLYMTWDDSFRPSNIQCISGSRGTSMEQCAMGEGQGMAFLKVSAVETTQNYRVRCGYVTRKTFSVEMQLAATEAFSLQTAQYWARYVRTTGDLFSDVTCSSTGSGNNNGGDVTLAMGEFNMVSFSSTMSSSNEQIRYLARPGASVTATLFGWEPSSGSITCQQTAATTIALSSGVSAGPYGLRVNQNTLFSFTVPTSATSTQVKCETSGNTGDLYLLVLDQLKTYPQLCNGQTQGSNEVCTATVPSSASDKTIYAYVSAGLPVLEYTIKCTIL